MPAVARRLAGHRDASDLPLLYGACDQLLAAGDAAALDVWLMTGQAAPSGIFNGDFASAPLNHGFDWRLIESTGVTHVGLNRILLSGRQPESCSLLQQTLMLAKGGRYRLRWESRTSGIKSPSGVEWRVAGQSAPLLPSEAWAPGELTVAAPETFSVLELAYRRPLGESRAEGSVELRNIQLQTKPPENAAAANIGRPTRGEMGGTARLVGQVAYLRTDCLSVHPGAARTQPVLTAHLWGRSPTCPPPLKANP
jgi:hypothetical protein